MDTTGAIGAINPIADLEKLGLYNHAAGLAYGSGLRLVEAAKGSKAFDFQDMTRFQGIVEV